nr:hypothetical protein [Mucilaginibacter sp. X5P1]
MLSASRSMSVEAFAHMLRLALSMTPLFLLSSVAPISKRHCEERSNPRLVEPLCILGIASFLAMTLLYFDTYLYSTPYTNK